MLNNWVENGRQNSPIELGELFRELVGKTLIPPKVGPGQRITVVYAIINNPPIEENFNKINYEEAEESLAKEKMRFNLIKIRGEVK